MKPEPLSEEEREAAEARARAAESWLRHQEVVELVREIRVQRRQRATDRAAGSR